MSDGRVAVNVAASVKPPAAGYTRREGQLLTLAEVDALANACRGPYADVVRVLALAGLRWGELAGLRVGDRIALPGPGLGLQRAVLASNDKGDLYLDTLKNKKTRTVPLAPPLVPIVESCAAGKDSNDWLFGSPRGGPLHESNWKRSVAWTTATEAIGRPDLRVHDLRHTCASVWLGPGADPKVVQRILGHASAAMTMDLYGHLIDQNLWDAAAKIGGTTGASAGPETEPSAGPDGGEAV